MIHCLLGPHGVYTPCNQYHGYSTINYIFISMAIAQLLKYLAPIY